MDAVDFVRYLGGLALVLALVGAAAIAARRYGLAHLVAPQGARRLQLVESLALGQRQRLVLVRSDDSELLILVASDTATLVGSSATPEISADA